MAALKDAEEQEQRRIQAERDRLAAEPTFNMATVPVNKLRPFYFFAEQNHSVGIKPFLLKEEHFEVHLCGGGGKIGGGRKLATAQVIGHARIKYVGISQSCMVYN